MLNLNRYSSYINNILKKKIPINNLKKFKKIKILYKKIILNNNFFKKQKIFLYKKTKLNVYKKFNYNIIIKKNNLNYFYINNLNYLYKNSLIKKEYFDFFLFFNKKINFFLNNYETYWLKSFYCFFKQTNKFFFINKIKFFSNQRLLKQNILLNYNYVNKINFYNNYNHIFKHVLLKKNNLFFYKIFNIYTLQDDNKNFFFKYNNYLNKFINANYLLLLLA